jgi:DNA-binding NarL/FixJ family response regulator
MKVLIADDHPVLREGLAALILQTEPAAEVLLAQDAASALQIAVERADLDIVILDLLMPGTNGHDVLAALGGARPELPVIVLTASEDPQDARQALAAGALGYVPKSASRQTLLAAIRMVLNGDVYIPPLILNEHLAEPGNQSGASRLLTARQIEVLGRLGEGQSNGRIAHELGISEKTVKSHISAIFRALNVVSRTQAAAAGRAAGLI